VQEIGSAFAMSITKPASGNLVYVVSITEVEIVSAIRRRLREGSFTNSDALLVISLVQNDFQHRYRVMDVTKPMLDRAISLVQMHPLRAYDAVQLAAALEVNERFAAANYAITFISSDVALNNAAQVEGLTVDDPNLHP
jgi:predicted nucleic acid-binding protein